MADQQPRGISAPFPAPPPFWKHFTVANLSQFERIKKQASPPTQDSSRAPKKHWKPSDLRALELRPELRYLVPPPPPPAGVYTVFGEEQNLSSTLPSLSSQSIPQLYPSPPSTPSPDHPFNHAFYLTKIAKSILLSFLELTSILAINPAQYKSKIEDLRHLFINAHHLINIYRPHQARETLIMMMEEQIEEGRREIEECNKVKEKVEDMLRDLEEEGRQVASDSTNGQANEVGDAAEHTSTDVKATEAKRLWDLINEEIRGD